MFFSRRCLPGLSVFRLGRQVGQLGQAGRQVRQVRQAGGQAGRQAGRQAGKQVGRYWQMGRQASRLVLVWASRQAGTCRQAGGWAGKQVVTGRWAGRQVQQVGTGRWAGGRVGGQVGGYWQVGKQAGTGRWAGRQVGGQVGRQAGRQVGRQIACMQAFQRRETSSEAKRAASSPCGSLRFTARFASLECLHAGQQVDRQASRYLICLRYVVMWSIKDRRQCVLPCTFFVWMIVLGFILILAFTKNDSKVNGKFKTLDMYRKEYGDMNSDKAKAYTSRLITEVCMSLFSLSFPFFSSNND